MEKDAVHLGHAHHEHDRCPFCHDAIAPDEPAWRCPTCLTPHHLECAEENGHCTVLGCDGRLERRVVIAGRRFDWQALRQAALLVLGSLFLIMGAVSVYVAGQREVTRHQHPLDETSTALGWMLMAGWGGFGLLGLLTAVLHVHSRRR